MDASEPVENENAITPTSISMMQKTFSYLVPPPISPYPTVVMVVITK
jgi:hypothetical protein